jgi:hypothetical protein
MANARWITKLETMAMEEGAEVETKVAVSCTSIAMNASSELQAYTRKDMPCMLCISEYRADIRTGTHPFTPVGDRIQDPQSIRDQWDEYNPCFPDKRP